MAYDKRIKADSGIFEEIRFIPVGDELILKPIIPQLIQQEAMLYLFNTNNEGVEKYLPSVHANNEEEAVKKLSEFENKMLLKQGLLYCIRFKQKQFPVGYINLNSPLCPTGLDSWTVDFWMAESMQGKGMMTPSLYCLLAHLQERGVPEVKALVSSDNVRSINTLERVGFEFISQEAGGERRFLYSVQLNDDEFKI